jgi:AcrR family transcriptional regulator
MAAASPRQAFADASRDLLRETVLDAVGELAADRPWSQVTMADIAERAGVSRQTLYNSFGSRQELAQAYVMREAERFLEAIEVAAREAAPDPRAALRAAAEIFLEAAQTHPVIRAVASSESGDELLPLLTTRGGPLVGEVTERLAELLIETWPGLAKADAFVVADTLARLAISHAALPREAPAETAEKLSEVLGPYLDQLVERLEHGSAPA